MLMQQSYESPKVEIYSTSWPGNQIQFRQDQYVEVTKEAGFCLILVIFKNERKQVWEGALLSQITKVSDQQDLPIFNQITDKDARCFGYIQSTLYPNIRERTIIISIRGAPEQCGPPMRVLLKAIKNKQNQLLQKSGILSDGMQQDITSLIKSGSYNDLNALRNANINIQNIQQLQEGNSSLAAQMTNVLGLFKPVASQSNCNDTLQPKGVQNIINQLSNLFAQTGQNECDLRNKFANTLNQVNTQILSNRNTPYNPSILEQPFSQLNQQIQIQGIQPSILNQLITQSKQLIGSQLTSATSAIPVNSNWKHQYQAIHFEQIKSDNTEEQINQQINQMIQQMNSSCGGQIGLSPSPQSIIQPNLSSTINANGSTTIVRPDGTNIVNNPDGTYTIRTPQQVVTQTNLQGTAMQNSPNSGQRSLSAPETSSLLASLGLPTNAGLLNPNAQLSGNLLVGINSQFGTSGIPGPLSPISGTVSGPISSTVSGPISGSVLGTVQGTILGSSPGTFTQRDGTIITKNPDGTYIITKPDQTVVKTNLQGTATKTLPQSTTPVQLDQQQTSDLLQSLGLNNSPMSQINPDGTMTQTMPNSQSKTTLVDGTVVQKNPDGTYIITKPDMTVIKTDLQGNGMRIPNDQPAQNLSIEEVSQILSSLGLMTAGQMSPNGSLIPNSSLNGAGLPNSQLETRTDGTTIRRNPDGTYVITKPDMTVIQTNLQGNGMRIPKGQPAQNLSIEEVSQILSSLGLMTAGQMSPNGSLIPNSSLIGAGLPNSQLETRSDGTTIRRNPDGTYVITKPDMTVIQTNLQGTATINQNGIQSPISQIETQQLLASLGLPQQAIDMLNGMQNNIQNGKQNGMVSNINPNLEGKINSNTDGSYTINDNEKIILIEQNGNVSQLGLGGVKTPVSSQEAEIYKFQLQSSGLQQFNQQIQNFQMGLQNFNPVYDTQNIQIESKIMRDIQNSHVTGISYILEQSISVKGIYPQKDGSTIQSYILNISQSQVIELSISVRRVISLNQIYYRSRKQLLKKSGIQD